MTKLSKLIITAAITALSACASAPGKIDTSKLHFVEENHAEINMNGQINILDSYIIPFQRPYHILVQKASGKPIMANEALQMATDYIKSRGCTTSPVRRADLDGSNLDKTQWLIGVEC